MVAELNSMTIQYIKDGNVILFDSADWSLIKGHTWRKDHWGYATAKPTINGKRKTLYMHRVILGIKDSSILSDHKNHNRLDNRRCNLRECSYTDNARNKTAIGRSKYLGVSWVYNSIVSRIYINGKHKHLGCFDDEKSAALAYNEAAKKYFGEFANLNNV